MNTFQRLRARFDLHLLVPPPEPLPSAATCPLPAAWVALMADCRTAATPGGAMLTAAVPSLPLGRPTLDALLHSLDGSYALQAAGGAVAGLWFRLAVKVRELLVAPRADDVSPWDCGYLRSDAGGLLALRTFTPRRPSLVVVAEAALTADDREWLAATGVRQAANAPLFSAPIGLPWCVLLLREGLALPAGSSFANDHDLHWRPGVWLE